MNTNRPSSSSRRLKEKGSADLEGGWQLTFAIMSSSAAVARVVFDYYSIKDVELRERPASIHNQAHYERLIGQSGLICYRRVLCVIIIILDCSP